MPRYKPSSDRVKRDPTYKPNPKFHGAGNTRTVVSIKAPKQVKTSIKIHGASPYGGINQYYR